MPLLYNLLLLAASPLLLVYLSYRLLIKGKSREGLGQRLGGAPRLGPAPPAGRVWLHAVSAGEVVAAAAIAKRLREADSAIEVVISTTTPAGQQQARRLLPEAMAWFYFPFDFLPCVWLALARVRPTVAATVETEIWPNWLWLARTLGIRTALVNGQFADKGFRGARKARPLYRWALGSLEALWMQTEQAAERALYLGAPADRVRVVGNVKFEQPVVKPAPEAARVVGERLGLDSPAAGDSRGEAGTIGGNRLFLAGSTHPGEEAQVLEAFRHAREAMSEIRLLLVPRHIERAGEVVAEVRRQGWAVGRRSEPATDPLEVLVLDTMGELAGLYALAEVVFVGGSLVPIGGHDILQPLFYRRPTLVGPHTHNQHDLVRLAREAGAVAVVPDAAALGASVVRLLSDPEQRAGMQAAGDRLLLQNTGAAQECANLLRRLAGGISRRGAEQIGVTGEVSR